MKEKTYTVTVEGIVRRKYRLTGKRPIVVENAKNLFINETALSGLCFNHLESHAVADWHKKEE